MAARCQSPLFDRLLAAKLAGAPIEPHLAKVIHARTDGSPLFLTTIVEYLLEHRILAIVDGRWQLALPAMKAGGPVEMSVSV